MFSVAPDVARNGIEQTIVPLQRLTRKNNFVFHGLQRAIRP
jgi:hypothetical protein